MYFCVIADPNLSQMAYLFQVALPNKLWDSLGKVVGRKQMNVLQSVLDLALVFVYFFVVLGCWTVVFWYIYPWIDKSTFVGKYHKYVGYLVFLACFGSWRLANVTQPGTVTSKSFKRYDHYPYDNLMFLPNRRCDTTNLIRIPRSKFDRLKYNQNVPRYDHFCGWVFNTIGEENYRWFLLFLAVHVVMCIYGSAVCTLLFWGELKEKHLLDITFFDRATGEHVQSNWFIVSQYLFMRKTLEFGVFAVMSVMGIALGGFLGYHVGGTVVIFILSGALREYFFSQSYLVFFRCTLLPTTEQPTKMVNGVIFEDGTRKNKRNIKKRSGRASSRRNPVPF